MTHTKRVIAATKGHAGARNDKTICRYDHFLVALRQNLIYGDVKFILRARDGSIVEEVGAYSIVDGGYHQWRVLQAVEKHASDEWSRAFSARGESVRKDVECAFGILKCRFRVLRSRILLRNKDDINNFFFACCILHNVLLKDDGWADRHTNPAFWTRPLAAIPLK